MGEFTVERQIKGSLKSRVQRIEQPEGNQTWWWSLVGKNGTVKVPEEYEPTVVEVPEEGQAPRTPSRDESIECGHRISFDEVKNNPGKY